jgi:peptide/nickel transport system permease protein
MSAAATSAAPRSALAESRLAAKPRSPLSIAFRQFRKSKLAIAGLVVIVLLTISALFAKEIAPYGQNQIDLFNMNANPSGSHLLGTDALGRDVFSRLIYGGRLSLWIGVTAALVSTLAGIVVGAVSGYYGGFIDSALMRFVDLMLAFPSIFLLLIVAAMLDGITVTNIIFFLGLFGWMWLARVIRGEFLSLKNREFVEAARSIGAADARIILRHMLPNVIGPIIVTFTLDIALFMLAEASLSFLGFGVQPGTPTWGNMLNESRTQYLTKPLLAIAPGLTLTIAVLAINFVGDGLRDALDPKAAKG